MEQRPEEIPAWQSRELTEEERRTTLSKYLGVLTLFSAFLAWRIGIAPVVGLLAIGGVIGLIFLKMPDEMRKNPTISIGFQIASFVIALIAAVVIVIR